MKALGMREKTKATIKAALWILIGLPAMWLVQASISRILGLGYRTPFSTFILFMVVYGAIAIWNIVRME
jgi:hypothetical protein